MLGHMVRLRPDGSKLTWRVAAMSKFEEAGREPKPFFITWDDPSVRPDKARAAHSPLPSLCPWVPSSIDCNFRTRPVQIASAEPQHPYHIVEFPSKHGHLLNPSATPVTFYQGEHAAPACM